jgi:hypothetical protein
MASLKASGEHDRIVAAVAGEVEAGKEAERVAAEQAARERRGRGDPQSILTRKAASMPEPVGGCSG